MPNDHLFVQVLAQIESEPERWNQRVWAQRDECGTSYCFAGWTCVLTSPLLESDFDWSRDLEQSGRTSRGHVSQVAASELGIDREQAADLFDISNSLHTIYRLSAQILGVDESVLRDKVRSELAHDAG